MHECNRFYSHGLSCPATEQSGKANPFTSSGTFPPHATNLVDDLLEVNCDLGILAIPMISRIVDKLRDLVKPQLRRSGVRDELVSRLAVMAMLRVHAGDSNLFRPSTKDEKHSVDHVRFPTAVRANDGRERLRAKECRELSESEREPQTI